MFAAHDTLQAGPTTRNADVKLGLRRLGDGEGVSRRSSLPRLPAFFKIF